jgi:hypothetical protein
VLSGSYRVLYMRFWADQNEVQKVDCIDLRDVFLVVPQGKKANLTEFS